MGSTDPDDQLTERHADRVRRVFGDAELAARYGRDRFPKSRHVREARTLAKLLPSLDPGPTLDLACGAGRFGADLAGRGDGVVGADASAAMLHEARRTGDYSLLVCADARRLPFGGRAFAGAICIRLLQHLDADDRRSVLSELRRVSSGPVIVSFFDAATFEAVRARLRRRSAQQRSRRAVSVSEIERDFTATGWRLSKLERKLGRLTEHVFALIVPVLVSGPGDGRPDAPTDGLRGSGAG